MMMGFCDFMDKKYGFGFSEIQVVKGVDNRRIYRLSVHPRVYLREQKASVALPFVPVGTGTPEFSVLSESTPLKLKSKKSCPREVRYED